MMRKLLFICLTILFVACSSDDNTSHSDSLIGKWKEVSFTVDGVVPDDLYIDECGTDSMEFIDDSVIIFTEWWDCEVSQYRVNYRLLSGGRIEVSLGGETEVVDYELKGDTLYIKYLDDWYEDGRELLAVQTYKRM